MITKSVSKDYDLTSNIIDYVITKNDDEQGVQIQTILNNYNDNLIIIDTNNIFLNESLDIVSSSEKDQKPIICLVSESMLKNMKNRDLTKLFVRSTKETIKNSFIIKDKSEFYIVGNKDRAYRIADEYGDKLYHLANYFIWNKATYELCKGEFSKVSDSKLSVLKPTLTDLEDVDYNSDFASTENLDKRDAIVAKNSKNIVGYKEGYITDNQFEGYLRKDGFYADVYDNKLVRILDQKHLFKSKFVTNVHVKDLVGQEITLLNGKTSIVNSKDTFETTEQVYLSEYMNPNVDLICNEAKEKSDLLTSHLTVKVILEPIIVDASYKKHRNYSNLEKLKNNLDDLINKLLNLKNSDKKAVKEISKIKDEHDLVQRAKLYNDYVSKTEAGVQSLNNKKQIAQINLVKKDIIVPSDLLGTLYEKNNKNYLATNERYYEEAVKWLKENNIEAKLIYDGR